MAHVVIKAKVAVRRVYVCRKCGTRQEGDGTWLELDIEGDAHTLAEAVRRRAENLSTHYMPLGWSSHWASKADVFQCATCNKGVDKA